MGEVGAFAAALAGCDVVFHAAAHFRDSYKGGRHWDELRRINVDGTAAIAAAHRGRASIRAPSSIAVLDGPPGTLIDETCDRLPADADDYYRSKILADDAVRAFLRLHPDMHACFVLPGWMWGQAISGRPRRGNWSMTWRAASCRAGARQFLGGRCPRRGAGPDCRGRTWSPGRTLSGGRAPHGNGRTDPAAGAGGRNSRADASCRCPAVRAGGHSGSLCAHHGQAGAAGAGDGAPDGARGGRTRFNPAKSEHELGLHFRPLAQTLADTVGWYRQHGWF